MLSLFYRRRNPVIGDRALPPGRAALTSSFPLVLGLFPPQGPGKAVVSLGPNDTRYAFWQLWGHGATLGLAGRSAVTLQSLVEEPGVALMPPQRVLSPSVGAQLDASFCRHPLSTFMVESDRSHCPHQL